jgi:hypothetical protein
MNGKNGINKAVSDLLTPRGGGGGVAVGYGGFTHIEVGVFRFG